MTVASNQFQNHNQLLRHGMLNWVTRGVFLGYQRNYLELQVDDLFLGDDAWDPATNTTNYDPDAREPDDADRRGPGDRLVARPGLRLDLAYNGGGSALYRSRPAPAIRCAAKFADPAVRAARSAAINHTLRAPEPRLLDGAVHHATRSPSNLAWATRQRPRRLNEPAEVVTGEHSGLANTRPGNPGTIDPPSFDDVEPRRPAARSRPARTTTR